ncbi:MAG: hypothetical protein GY799_21370 [Desulfobulbaceae bacterium]|nr:hypothetical protein [Desulfobulbaceae bacterium]
MLGPASKKQELILNSDAQILVCGGAAGSGKSYLLNMIPLRYVDCPKFNGIVFRRTTVQLKGQGGMFDTAREIFTSIPKNSQPHIREYDLTATWANGAKIKYSHLEHEKNKYDHQGLQYTLIGIDEGTHFSFTQVEYLMSRLRSSSKYPSRMVISCNPDPDSWLYDLVEWYLDDEGLPDPKKDGKVRWFIRRDGEFVWGSKKELIKRYSTERKPARPISFQFISSTIYDNPIVQENNPEYVDFLEGLNPIDKARLLHGNWKVRPLGANYFSRDDLNKADRVPKGALCCRAWDKAATQPSDVNAYPDYTACCKMYKTEDGEFYITGEFDKDNHDADDPECFGRFRFRPGKRDMTILKQAMYDGPDCRVILPVDPGAHGLTEYIESAKKLAVQGFICKKDVVAPQRSKLQKFVPFSSAVENHLIYIVESTFNKRTLEKFYKELEAFDGERSGKLLKDDWPDAVATAYNYLTKETIIPKFSLPECGVNTGLMEMRRAIKS